MTTFQFYGDRYQLLTELFRSLDVPSYQASVDIKTHDTGYPGLATRRTVVEIGSLEDKELETLVCKLFQKMSFKEK